MYGCESWTIKKAKHSRIDAFELWCWRRLLRVPWTARRSKQSILMGISPEYSLEVLLLKLKLWYFGHLMQIIDYRKRNWWWERLRAEGKGPSRGWDGLMIQLIWCTWVWTNSGCYWWTVRPRVLQSVVLQRVAMNEQLNNSRIIHFSKKLRHNFQDDTQKKYQFTSHAPIFTAIKTRFSIFKYDFPEVCEL